MRKITIQVFITIHKMWLILCFYLGLLIIGIIEKEKNYFGKDTAMARIANKALAEGKI